MIISLRGTHGSGKSYVVHQLLDRYKAVPESLDAKGRPNNYVFSLPNNGQKVFVIGRYTTACGGCDGIRPYSEIWPRVEQFASLGHVLFEGALISSSYGSIGRNSEPYGDDFVFAILDTPAEVCLERIRQRRLARGNNKPLNPKNTLDKIHSIELSIKKMEQFGRRVVTIDYRKALPQVVKLLYETRTP